jgi:hypothetical protein
VQATLQDLDICDSIRSLFLSQRRAFTVEMDLQDEVQDVLERLSIPYVREPQIDKLNRPDFMVRGCIAIECKTKGTVTALLRQIGRYATASNVHRIIVVSSRFAHGDLPEEMYGKPIYFIHAGGAF